MVSVISDRYKL